MNEEKSDGTIHESLFRTIQKTYNGLIAIIPPDTIQTLTRSQRYTFDYD